MTTKTKASAALPQMTRDEFTALNQAQLTLKWATDEQARLATKTEEAKAKVHPFLSAVIARLGGGKQVFGLQLKSETKVEYPKDKAFVWLTAPSRLGMFSRLLKVRKDSTQVVVTHLELVSAIRQAYEAYAAQTPGGTMTAFLTDSAALIAPFMAIMLGNIQSPADLLEVDDSAYKAEVNDRINKGAEIINGEVTQADGLVLMPADSVTPSETIAFISKGAATGQALLNEVELTDAPRGSDDWYAFSASLPIPF